MFLSSGKITATRRQDLERIQVRQQRDHMAELRRKRNGAKEAMPRMRKSDDSGSFSSIDGWACIDCKHLSSHFDDCWSKPVEEGLKW